MSFYIGCPIWSFKGWVGNFYPQGTKPGKFLREYTRRMTTVEGNTTFYAIPSKQTIENWAAEMPEGFQFCPKLLRTISHEGKLSQHIDDAQSFMDIMAQLGSRLGPTFLQLPPRYSPHQFDDLKTFLEAWPRDYQLAVEVRHLDWFDGSPYQSLNQMLTEHNIARVVIDTRPIRNLKGNESIRGSAYESLLEARERKPDVPVIPENTTDFVFIRYIGYPQLAHNVAFLDEWANYLVTQLQRGANAYVFCHSPDNLIAPYLCRELHQRVSEKVPVSPLPWDEANANTLQQGRLF